MIIVFFLLVAAALLIIPVLMLGALYVVLLAIPMLLLGLLLALQPFLEYMAKRETRRNELKRQRLSK